MVHPQGEPDWQIVVLKQDVFLNYRRHLRRVEACRRKLRNRRRRAQTEVMRISRRAKDPLVRRPGLQPSTPRPWDPPQTQFPGIVPISTLLCGQSDRAAIAITGMSAYSSGFGFVITRLGRPGTPGWDQEPFTAQSLFEVSLRLSDGRTVSTGKRPGGTEPAGPFLRGNGGGGSSHYNQTRWWAWPLPPSGPLEFICQWPAMGISDTRAGIEAELILSAARRSIQIWPESQG